VPISIVFDYNHFPFLLGEEISFALAAYAGIIVPLLIPAPILDELLAMPKPDVLGRAAGLISFRPPPGVATVDLFPTVFLAITSGVYAELRSDLRLLSADFNILLVSTVYLCFADPAPIFVSLLSIDNLLLVLFVFCNPNASPFELLSIVDFPYVYMFCSIFSFIAFLKSPIIIEVLGFGFMDALRFVSVLPPAPGTF
jgi:hypothetical protein